MKYQIVRELMGTAIPCTFHHGQLTIQGQIVMFTPGDGFRFICAGCGFIMHGGSPATCGRCGGSDIILDFEASLRAEEDGK